VFGSDAGRRRRREVVGRGKPDPYDCKAFGHNLVSALYEKLYGISLFVGAFFGMTRLAAPFVCGGLGLGVCKTE
jgi:hypothetical protein